MAATKRQFNWSSVGWTPSGGSLTNCTGVTNISVTSGNTLAKFSGDNDKLYTTIVSEIADPSVTVTSADAAWVLGIGSGARGTLVATHRDAKAGSGGALTFTFSNAISESPAGGGQHRQFGSYSVTFYGESTDGSTSPLAYAFA